MCLVACFCAWNVRSKNSGLGIPFLDARDIFWALFGVRFSVARRMLYFHVSGIPET